MTKTIFTKTCVTKMRGWDHVLILKREYRITKMHYIKNFHLQFLLPRLYKAKSRHRLQLGRHRFQFYDKCKQVQVDLGRIKKKVELFEKSKLLFSNLFLKISRIIVIDLHFFCSVNRSHNRIHVHQAWRAIFTVYIRDIDDQFLNSNSELVL